MRPNTNQTNQKEVSILGNRKKQRKHRVHKRIVRSLLVAGTLTAVGMFIHHEVVFMVAGSAFAAVFDVFFQEIL